MAVATRARGNGALPRAVAAAAAAPVSGAVRRRRPVWTVCGVALVVVCATIGALAASAVDHRRPVVVLTRTVQPGETIRAGDLGFARMSGSRLSTVANMASVVGKVATGRLPAGSVLSPGEVAAPSAADADSVELPMSLKAGMFPPDLAAGDQVLLVATTAPSALSAGPSTPAAPVAAQVASVVTNNSFGSTGSTTITVTVPREALSGLADAAAAGQVLIAKVGS